MAFSLAISDVEYDDQYLGHGPFCHLTTLGKDCGNVSAISKVQILRAEIAAQDTDIYLGIANHV